VLMALSSLRHGSRRSPVVTFVEDVVPSTLLGSELVLDTEQDVDSAYQLLVKSGNPSTMSAAYEEGAPRKVCVNWNLVHSNGFRRVLMYYLSECGHVVCYGDTHQSSTPSAEQSESKDRAALVVSPVPSSPMSTSSLVTPSPSATLSAISEPESPVVGSLPHSRSPSPIHIDTF